MRQLAATLLSIKYKDSCISERRRFAHVLSLASMPWPTITTTTKKETNGNLFVCHSAVCEDFNGLLRDPGFKRIRDTVLVQKESLQS